MNHSSRHEVRPDVPYVGTTFGPYVGYKCFEYTASVGKVCSSFRGSHEWWPNRGAEVADCRPSDAHRLTSHKAPEDDHTCGYHMYFTLEQAMEHAHLFRRASDFKAEFVALVAAWGQVVHHETGLRSEMMEIVAIHDGPYDFLGELEILAAKMDIPFLPRADLHDYALKIGVLQ